MIYKLLKKTFGTKKIEKLVKIETEYPINDICYVDNLGIVFSTYCCLGVVTDSRDSIYPWKGSEDIKPKTDGSNPYFGFLTSLGYLSDKNRLFVTEDCGKNVRALDLGEDYCYSLIRGEEKKVVGKLLNHTPEHEPAYISPISTRSFYIAFPSIKKSYLCHDSVLKHVAGDGRSRFSVGNNAINSSIGIPSGICAYDRKVYLSDSLNGVVRVLDGESISLSCGIPKQNELKSPSKLTISKKTMFIMCQDSVKTTSLDKNSPMSVYESDTIRSISTASDGELYILEEDNA